MISQEKRKTVFNKTQIIRLSILILVLALLSWIGYRHQVLGGGPAGVPTVDALCPFGGLESIYSWISEGSWLRRVAASSLILFIGVAAITVLSGRVFCGWVCPLGAVNEFLAIFSRKLGIKKVELPASLDRPLRLLKYLILIVILFSTWRLGTLTFRPYDPWAAWMHLSAGWSEVGYGTLVLLITLILGIFIERFWCRYLCPLGAVLELVSRFSIVKVRRDEDSCINCGACHDACPMGLSPDKDIVQKNGECIVCGKCSAACPVPGTMMTGALKRTFSFMAVGIVGVAMFIAVIAGSKLTGYWQTFAVPAQVAGIKSADNVFGWMNIEQVANTVGLPVKIVLQEAGLALDTPRDVSLKKLPGVDDEEVKDKLRVYMEKNEASSNKKLSPQELRGSVSLSEICTDYSIDPKLLLEKLRLPSDTDMNIPVKDILSPLGREVQEVRDVLSALTGQR